VARLAGRAFDVWKVSDRAALDAARRQALARTPARVRVVQEGVPRTVPLPLEAVGHEEYAAYLGDVANADTGDVLLLRGVFPKGDDPNAPVQLTTEASWTMAKADHYCYWVAGRPIELERIVFDCRGLTLGGERPAFTCQPFFASEGVHVAEQDGRFTVDVYGFVGRGQAAILSWRSKKELAGVGERHGRRAR
jgi:hypothetical protein